LVLCFSPRSIDAAFTLHHLAGARKDKAKRDAKVSKMKASEPPRWQRHAALFPSAVCSNRFPVPFYAAQVEAAWLGSPSAAAGSRTSAPSAW